MSHPFDLPVWLALIVGFLTVMGAAITLIGTIGLFRFRSFYSRMHAPTLGTTWGAGSLLIASMICFSALTGRLIVHELLIAAFIFVTTPVTLMLLGRAALHRDGLDRAPQDETPCKEKLSNSTDPGAKAPDRS